MYFSIIRLPQLHLYWSTSTLFHGLWARAFMSKRRYKQIQTFLKVSDYRTENANDRLTKVRFLTEYIRRKCIKLWQPREHISIDERMVANKGRYSFRQYIKDKPTKWGMKLWVLADSSNGYTCNFDVYLGKKDKSNFGLAYDVVLNLVKHLYNQGYKLFVDNFYSSVHLFKFLLEKGISACGTIICNRKGFPKCMKDIKSFKKGVRGHMRYVREGVIGFLQWNDNKVVSLITTMHKQINSFKFCNRRVKANNVFRKMLVRQPTVVSDYNIHMGGVDKSDQMIGKYKTLRRTSKFWKTLFYHMIDISKVNSKIMFDEFRKLEKNLHIKELERKNDFGQLDFTLELIRELANISDDMPIPIYKPKLRLDFHHVQPEVSDIKRNCIRCYRLFKKELKTVNKCTVCDKHFCFNKSRNCLWEEHKP